MSSLSWFFITYRCCHLKINRDFHKEYYNCFISLYSKLIIYISQFSYTIAY